MQNVIGALRQRIFSSGATEGKNIVAFSGGVDSSLVAALVHQTFPNNSLACVGISAALPEAQLHLARSVASHIGIPLKEVSTTEGSNPDYIANEGQSCFHCKTHLYSALEAVAAQAGVESRHHGESGESVGVDVGVGVGVGADAIRRDVDVVLFNGTNKDDKRDTTRVGLKAAADFRVASPIDVLTKEEVRAVSRNLGLPNWNHAASPCLRSRLAFGVQATPDRLAVVEKAEDVARKRLGLGVSHNLRVRAMRGNKALLEVDAGETMEEALRAMSDIRSLILPLGFEEVDVRAFRSGAVSGGASAIAATDEGADTRLKGVLEKGSMGVDVYRVGDRGQGERRVK